MKRTLRKYGAGLATVSLENIKVSWTQESRRINKTRYFSSAAKAEEFCDKLIAQWTSDGYTEPPAPRPIPPSRSVVLVPGGEPVSIRVLRAEEAGPPYLDLDYTLAESDVSNCFNEVLLIEGDLSLPGDFTGLSSLALPDDLYYLNEVIIAIAGDLTVAGRIDFLNYSPHLFVAGKTTAETIECGSSIICLEGHATIEYFASGHGNDGYMQVENADVPFIISDRGHGIGVAAPNALKIDMLGDYCRDSDGYHWGQSDIEATFVAEVLDDESSTLDPDAFYEHLKRGCSVFLDGESVENKRLQLRQC